MFDLHDDGRHPCGSVFHLATPALFHKAMRETTNREFYVFKEQQQRQHQPDQEPETELVVVESQEFNDFMLQCRQQWQRQHQPNQEPETELVVVKEFSKRTLSSEPGVIEPVDTLEMQFLEDGVGVQEGFIKPTHYYLTFDLSNASQVYLPTIIALLGLLLTPKYPKIKYGDEDDFDTKAAAKIAGNLVARFDALASALPKHLSPLHSAPMRELALVIADRTARQYYCKCSAEAKVQYTNLVQHITLSGQPASNSASPHTQFLRDWIARCGVQIGSDDRPFPYDVETALIRNRWRHGAGQGLELLVANHGSEASKKDLLDTFKEVGFLDTAEGRLATLKKLAEGQEWDYTKTYPRESQSNNALSIRLIEYALSSCFPVGFRSFLAMSKNDRRRILPHAALYTGNKEILVYLLDNGLEEVLNTAYYPPRKSYGIYGIKWEACFVLHLAIRWGDINMVRMLLDRGAKMLQDQNGKTPLLVAEDSSMIAVAGKVKEPEGRKEKAELIKAALKERGLPREHFDEPDEYLSEGEAAQGTNNKL